MSRPPAIPWERIRGVLSCYPDGLPTPEIATLAAPVPGKGNTVLLCHMMLRRHEGLGHVRRAGRAASSGIPVIWQLPRQRREAAQVYALELRKLVLLRRRLAALVKIEEALEELEQVEREMAALDRSLGSAAELPGSPMPLRPAGARRRTGWCPARCPRG